MIFSKKKLFLFLVSFIFSHAFDLKDIYNKNLRKNNVVLEKNIGLTCVYNISNFSYGENYIWYGILLKEFKNNQIQEIIFFLKQNSATKEIAVFAEDGKIFTFNEILQKKPILLYENKDGITGVFVVENTKDYLVVNFSGEEKNRVVEFIEIKQIKQKKQKKQKKKKIEKYFEYRVNKELEKPTRVMNLLNIKNTIVNSKPILVGTSLSKNFVERFFDPVAIKIKISDKVTKYIVIFYEPHTYGKCNETCKLEDNPVGLFVFTINQDYLVLDVSYKGKCCSSI